MSWEIEKNEDYCIRLWVLIKKNAVRQIYLKSHVWDLFTKIGQTMARNVS